MTAANIIINILQPYLKKIENAYKRVLYFDDIDYQKNGYAVGKGGLIISVKKGDASLAIQLIEKMSLENSDTRWSNAILQKMSGCGGRNTWWSGSTAVIWMC